MILLPPGKLKKGFTLLEVVAVIGLLAIVAVVVAPSLGSFNSSTLLSVSSVVMTDIRHTQKSAMIKGDIRSIQFSPGQKYNYDIPVGGIGVVRDISAIGSSATFANRVLITFNAMGEPLTGPLVVTIVDGANPLTIAVEPVSGKVTLH